MADLRKNIDYSIDEGLAWRGESVYNTETVYLNGGQWNKADVTLRYDFLAGTLDIVGFETFLTGLTEPMSAEDFTIRIARLMAEVCAGWYHVQVVARVPNATYALTCHIKGAGA